MRPAEIDRGAALFDAGRYWDAHEEWEGVWRQSTGSDKVLLQALILWAAALHQHRKGVPKGARTLMARAVGRINEARSPAFGFEVDSLRDALVDCWAQLERGNVVEVVRLDSLVTPDGPQPMELDHRATCPYCGEPVLVSIEIELAGGAQYVEDCPVCCRPWDVRVLAGERLTVELGRHDD